MFVDTNKTPTPTCPPVMFNHFLALANMSTENYSLLNKRLDPTSSLWKKKYTLLLKRSENVEKVNLCVFYLFICLFLFRYLQMIFMISGQLKVR